MYDSSEQRWLNSIPTFVVLLLKVLGLDSVHCIFFRGVLETSSVPSGPSGRDLLTNLIKFSTAPALIGRRNGFLFCIKTERVG